MSSTQNSNHELSKTIHCHAENVAGTVDYLLNEARKVQKLSLELVKLLQNEKPPLTAEV
jgi:hypothetical protein